MGNKENDQITIKSIAKESSFFRQLDVQLRDAIYSLAQDIPDHNFENHLKIYMPSYINLLYFRYLRQELPTLYYPSNISLSDQIKTSKFMGVEVVDNYQDNIVVAVKDGIINKIEPIIINIS